MILSGKALELYEELEKHAPTNQEPDVLTDEEQFKLAVINRMYMFDSVLRLLLSDALIQRALMATAMELFSKRKDNND